MSVKQRKTMNSSYFSTPPVVKNLIIINCLAFLGVWLIPSLNQFMGQYGVLYWFGSPYYHSYQFVTYMFLHASLEHLFFNMFALWMFGRTLEYALGSKRFLIYYMVCGVGAALVQMGVAGLTDEFGIQLLGASGAVMGLLLAFGVLWPNSIIMLLIPPIPLKANGSLLSMRRSNCCWDGPDAIPELRISPISAVCCGDWDCSITGAARESSVSDSEPWSAGYTIPTAAVPAGGAASSSGCSTRHSRW